MIFIPAHYYKSLKDSGRLHILWNQINRDFPIKYEEVYWEIVGRLEMKMIYEILKNSAFDSAGAIRTIKQELRSFIVDTKNINVLTYKIYDLFIVGGLFLDDYHPYCMTPGVDSWQLDKIIDEYYTYCNSWDTVDVFPPLRMNILRSESTIVSGFELWEVIEYVD
nr:MAG TPA: hypothetical protein [Caudoviricetes sp.]